MSFINKIQTNIKSPNGENYSVPLGQYTILLGENEAGKSAIAEAAQLARVGSAHGLLYRDKPIKDGALLSALIPPDQDRAEVSASLSDGTTCSWSLEMGSRPSRSGPNGAVLAVSELHAAMAGSVETKAKFFWDRMNYGPLSVCRPQPINEVTARIPGHLQAAFFTILPDASEVGLTDLLARVGKAQRDQSSVAKAGKIALESLGSVQPISDDEVQGGWKTLHRALLRDILKDLYTAYRADPTLQAGPVISYLIEGLGGKAAIQRVPTTTEAQGEVASALLNRRLGRAAVAAKGGEARAEGLGSSLKELKGVLLQLILEDLENEAEMLRRKVGQFLLPKERLYFMVNPAQKALTIGLFREGQVHTALSGSTEARVLAALAAALSGPSSLIVVDDRMWDSGTLAKTMAALERAPGQVLLMSTVKPRGRKRGKWNYIEIVRTPGEALEINE